MKRISFCNPASARIRESHRADFAFNPISGKLLADFVAEGRTSSDLDVYSPDRFENETTRHFLAEPMTQGLMVEMRPYKARKT